MNEENFYIPRHLWAPTGESFMDKIKSKDKENIKEFLSSLDVSEQEALLYNWKAWARPNQLPPPNDFIDHPLGWKYWLFFAGRATGKTRLAAEWVRSIVESNSTNTLLRIALAGPTYKDVLQTMINGESGLMSVFPPDWTLKINKNEGVLHFINPKKEKVALGLIYTGEEPDRVRGPQHHYAWIDELAAFAKLEEFWSLFEAGLRLGKNPQAIFTTTPKASLNKISLLKKDERLICSVGNPRNNANNLPPSYVQEMLEAYEGTDMGEQEIEGKLYLDESGALFKQSWINQNRIVNGNLSIETCKENQKPNILINISGQDKPITIVKTLVAIDPSGSTKDAACECGILVGGFGADGYGYVIEDASFKASPADWARKAIELAIKYKAAVAYESNFGGLIGGDLLRATFREIGAKVTIDALVATKDKYNRATPISALTQKGRIKFLGNKFLKLEQQLTTWVPGDKSPDRMDAYVWCFIRLFNQPVRANLTTNILGF